MIRIDLDSIRKDLNPKQGTWTRQPRAVVSTQGHKPTFTAVGAKASLQAVCTALSDLGVADQAEVYRGDTCVFAHPINISSMAKGVVSPNPPEEKE